LTCEAYETSAKTHCVILSEAKDLIFSRTYEILRSLRSLRMTSKGAFAGTSYLYKSFEVGLRELVSVWDSFGNGSATHSRLVLIKPVNRFRLSGNLPPSLLGSHPRATVRGPAAPMRFLRRTRIGKRLTGGTKAAPRGTKAVASRPVQADIPVEPSGAWHPQGAWQPEEYLT
jgi:hypothetical protein